MEIFNQEKLKAYVYKSAQPHEEVLDYNKIDIAFKSVDIQLKDVNGQFKSLNDIFFELSEKWDILENNKDENIFIVPIEDKPIKIVFEGEHK